MNVSNAYNHMTAATMMQRYQSSEKNRGDGYADTIKSSADNPSSPETDLSKKDGTKKATDADNTYDTIFAPSDAYKSLNDIAATYDLNESPLNLTSLANALYTQGHIDGKSREMLKNSAETPEAYTTDIVALWEDKLSLMVSAGASEYDIRRTKNMLRVLKNIKALATGDLAFA
jgi:hypothetical protein